MHTGIELARDIGNVTFEYHAEYNLAEMLIWIRGLDEALRSAQRAYELGLINHVVPDGQALAKAKQIAERIAANGPLAVKAILATLRETETLPEKDAFGIEMGHGMKAMSSKDAVEGPRAFLEKRPPVFTGQ